MKNVLISGSGIGGSALARLLGEQGRTVTVVERAPAPRRGGQAIDIRGVALDVVGRLGLLDRARGARTRMRGMSVLDGDGNEIHRSTESTFSSGRLGNGDIEVLREDFVRMLHERVGDGAEFLYGDSITALEDAEEGVRVTFERAAPRTFDLVVGADGLHSGVRRLAFGAEERFIHHLDMHIAIFGADNFLGLDNWQVWLREGAAGYGIYPVRDNTELRVTFGFEGGPLGPGARTQEAYRALVAARMAPLRWENDRLLKALREAPDFYADAVAQVRMDRWSRGRAVLLGDAGYGASVLSGQGTGLALVGAQVLADELARADGDHTLAFARYEERMRPFVTVNQALVEGRGEAGSPASEEALDRAKNAIVLEV
ncbi:FAD-dependent monooxygenase [Streptomyces sp. NPDC001787]|uniref:FAD-dependent monooxygenase n=1 Tax=Streptomyces sp. NPDC001787 TaxID=3154523 RepID=UPI003328A855